MKLVISAFILLVSLFCKAQFEFTRVKDISPSGNSDPSGFVVANGKLLCIADDGVHGRELFEIDSLGTNCTLFKDINLVGSSMPFGFVYFENKYWFGANDGVHGTELWTTEGSPTSTQRFSDIDNPSELCFDELTLANDKLFFARYGTNGSELWVTNGSQEGTVLVKNLGPSMADNPYGLTPSEGKVYFNAYDNYWGVWVSDGTETGTRLVKKTCPIYQYGCAETNIKVCSKKVYFQDFEFDSGLELWTLDTDTDSVFIVEDINPTGSSNPWNLIIFNDRLYFSADDGVHGSELWTTDGTSEGTFMVKDINPSGMSFPGMFSIYSDKMYFQALDGVHGWELWCSDGTETGTFMVKDCNPNGNCYIDSFIEFEDQLYFRGSDDTGKFMWVTDGTSEGTHKVEPHVNYNATPLLTYPHWTVYNNALFMGAEYDLTGKELWKFTKSSLAVSDCQLPNFSIYPNPANSSIRLRGITPEFEFSINDITGKCIINQKVDDFGIDIAIQMLNPGFYFITIIQNGKLEQLKLIKQ